MEQPNVGDFIQHFEITRELDEGGMGTVFLAEDTRLKRSVIIKFPKSDDPDFLKRFDREGRAQAQFNHPNICTIHDIGVHREFGPYIVMERIEGESLRKRLLRGRMTAKEAVDVAIDVAKALECTHSKVVHRDLSYNNIMFTSTGSAKVLDFGLALFSAEPRFTIPAAAMGTPNFMAPEQRDNPLAADHRCDIFALGMNLFRMIKGSFPQPTLPPPPLSSFRACADVPAKVDTIVTRALQPDAESRYATAGEMLQDLEEARKILAGIPRDYSYFDSTVLMDIVCEPPLSDENRLRSMQARDVFRVEFEQQRAVASPFVLKELVENIGSLYFEEKGLPTDRVKDAVARARAALKLMEDTVWSNVPEDKRRAFLRAVSPHFLPDVAEMAKQLTAVPFDPVRMVQQLGALCESELSAEEKWQIADAYALRSASMFTERETYALVPQKLALGIAGINLRLIPEMRSSTATPDGAGPTHTLN